MEMSENTHNSLFGLLFLNLHSELFNRLYAQAMFGWPKASHLARSMRLERSGVPPCISDIDCIPITLCLASLECFS